MKETTTDKNKDIKNKTTYLILTLIEKLKKKKESKIMKKTLLLISLCIIGLLQNNNCFAEENVPLATETYNFSEPSIQYNPTTQTWETNQKTKKTKKNKKNIKNKNVTPEIQQNQPQQINRTYPQTPPTYNQQPIQNYSPQVQQNYSYNQQQQPQTYQQPHNNQPYYQPPQHNYYQSYAQQILIPSGTPISAYVEKLIDADDVNEGQEVILRVQQPVKIQGVTVIKANTPIIANVTEHKNNGIFGIPGRIAVGNFKIRLQDGNIINLSGSISHKGQNRYWVDFVAWFFLWPMLFVKGEDGKIQAGVQQMLYTNGDAYVTY